MTWILLFLTLSSPAEPGERALQELAAEFWAWRTTRQPSGPDDIPRVERPDGWVPRYSPEDLARDRAAYPSWRRRLNGIRRDDLSRTGRVDWLLMRSAIERVRWEHEILRAPYRNPDFYTHQTLGALYELLLIQGEVPSDRLDHMIRIMASIPTTLEHARTNLIDPVKPFARIAIGNLKGADEKLGRVVDALSKTATSDQHQSLTRTGKAAGKALMDFRTWLEGRLDEMSDDFVIGREAYAYFLENVALIPASPEELLQQGRQEWHRAVAFEVFEQGRNAGLPELPLFADAEAQIIREVSDERDIRAFLEAKNIMTVPGWMGHYVNRKTPARIAPLAHMGVVDDLTGPSRLDSDGVSYIPEPRPGMSYFRAACARDPRPIIVHEGVPGHYYQLTRSWKNPDPIRRHYYDSGANEGIGFYVEEMLLQFGLFDNRPKTREIIYNFMRLRALRVEVDIRLAIGDMTIEEAGAYLAEAVPMDEATAVEEAGFFAMVPGQAITYQIGKIQITEFLAKARLRQGKSFDLSAFHDYLIVNGNVPIALLQWEYLGEEEPLPF